jgi:hypothetical protein
VTGNWRRGREQAPRSLCLESCSSARERVCSTVCASIGSRGGVMRRRWEQGMALGREIERDSIGGGRDGAAGRGCGGRGILVVGAGDGGRGRESLQRNREGGDYLVYGPVRCSVICCLAADELGPADYRAIMSTGSSKRGIRGFQPTPRAMALVP